MWMDPRSSGPALCLAAPSSRRACGGGTDLAPSLGSPPRAGWAPGSALAPSRRSRGGRRSARTGSRWPTRTSETSAEKRLPLPRICGGGTGAGPASGVKATATALRAEGERNQKTTSCSSEASGGGEA